jgi:hypothetical protein
MGMIQRAIKNVTATPEELAAGIRDQLDAARASVADLVRQQNEAAEASVSSPTAIADYEKLTASLATVTGDIRRLETALTTIEAKAAARKRVLAEQASLRARGARILDQRLEVARRLSVSVEALVRDWRELVELSSKAGAAYPRLYGDPSEAAAFGSAQEDGG